MVISDFEYKKMIKKTEWELQSFLKDNPEMEKEQEVIQENLDALGDNQVAKLQYLMGRISNNSKLMVKELELLDAHHKTNQALMKKIVEELMNPEEVEEVERPSGPTLSETIEELIVKWKKLF